MDPTIKQANLVKRLRGVFGKDVIHPHAPDPRTGVMRVTADSKSGQHEWFYDTDGNMIGRQLTQRLFDAPQVIAKPRNAQDN